MYSQDGGKTRNLTNGIMPYRFFAYPHCGDWVHTWIQICSSLNHCWKMKAEHKWLIPRKPTEKVELLTVVVACVTLRAQLHLDFWNARLRTCYELWKILSTFTITKTLST